MCMCCMAIQTGDRPIVRRLHLACKLRRQILVLDAVNVCFMRCRSEPVKLSLREVHLFGGPDSCTTHRQQPWNHHRGGQTGSTWRRPRGMARQLAISRKNVQCVNGSLSHLTSATSSANRKLSADSLFYESGLNMVNSGLNICVGEVSPCFILVSAWFVVVSICYWESQNVFNMVKYVEKCFCADRMHPHGSRVEAIGQRQSASNLSGSQFKVYDQHLQCIEHVFVTHKGAARRRRRN